MPAGKRKATSPTAKAAKMSAGRPGTRPQWYDKEIPVRTVIEARLSAQGREQDGEFQCCYCDVHYAPDTLEIEHVVPFTTISLCAHSYSEWEIVTNDVANLTYAGGKKACGCNQSKSDQDLVTFLGGGKSKVDDWLDNNPEFKWLHTGGTGALNYIPPWKPRTISNPDDEAVTIYQSALQQRTAIRKTDLIPREVVKSEKCYVDMSDHIISPVDVIDVLIKRAKVNKNDVLLTYSDSSHTSDELHIKYKPANIQQICRLTLMAFDNKDILKKARKG